MRTRALIAVLAAPAAAFVLACSASPSSSSNRAGPQDPGTGGAAGAATEAAAPEPTGPVTAFADGTYEVGTGAGQVPPGKYKTTAGELCYWARLRNLSGDGDIIASDLVKEGAPVIVTILASDKGFKTERCGTWRKS